MEKYLKFLKKLPPDQRKLIVNIWQQILENNLADLKVKKLKGFENYYSIRKGSVRLVFKIVNGVNHIINIDYRKNIYRDLN